MKAIRLRLFSNTGREYGEWDDVEIPRVPCVGELITGPDDTGSFQVSVVDYRYDDGFAFAPREVYVVARQ